MTRGPTERQRRAVLDTLANAGRAKPKSRKRILLDAGYSPAIAKNPEAVETSKGWQQLMEKYLPDRKLVSVHKEGLDATRKVPSPKKRGVYISVPDHPTRHKFLETAYKIKDRMKGDGGGGDTNVIVNIISFTSNGGNATA